MYHFCHLLGISNPNIVEIATGVVCGGIFLTIVGAIFIFLMDLAEGALDRFLPD